MPGGVALVFPYFRTRARTEVLFPPLGPALLSAHLKRAGVEARVFDGTFSSLEALVDDVVAWRPAVVGISSMVSLTGNALRVAAAVRERLPDALLVAGGPLPTVFPGRFLPHVDLVFRGEADVSFPAFCRDYLARGATRDDLGDLPLATYSGLVADGGGLARRQPAGAPLAGGDRRLSPARPRGLRPPRLPERVGVHRPPADHARRDARLPLRLRVLLQAGLRRRRAPAPARQGLRRGRGHRPPRVRRPVDRRRHLHAPPRLPRGVLPPRGAAAPDLELPLSRQRDRRRPRLA